MTVQARWNGVVVAESDKTILVEGNHYFPPADVKSDLLQASETSSHCPWKGDASYYDIVVDGTRNQDAAWYYPAPFERAAAIESYVAFWRGVEVTGTNPDAPEIEPPERPA
jgi:uncharacterized protein (DUF427 family)